VRVDDLGGRVVDVRPDRGNAAIADRDITGLARGSRAVEEKPRIRMSWRAFNP